MLMISRMQSDTPHRGPSSDRPSISLSTSNSEQAGQPLYAKVKTAIRDQIASGSLEAGQQLPTIRQLSEEFGMAYATVARGIRDLVEEGVLEAKTARGTRVANRRRSQRGAIGILGNAPLQRLVQDSRYQTRMIHLLQDAVIHKKQTVVFNHLQPQTPLAEMFNGLQLVDGLLVVVLRKNQEHQVREALRMGVPIVTVANPEKIDVPFVDSDEAGDTTRALKAMFAMGHSRIAFVGCIDESNIAPHTRLNAYRNAMSEAGFAAAELEVCCQPEETPAQLLAMRPRPTAAFFANGWSLPHVCPHLDGTELEVGKGLFICAYDEDLWDYLSPRGVSHMRIDQPMREIADTAISELMHLLDDHNYAGREILLPSTLVAVGDDGSVRMIEDDT